MNPEPEFPADAAPLWVDPESVADCVESPAEAAIIDLINHKVALRRSLDEVLNFVFDTTRALFPCDRLGLALLEENGARAVAHWARADYSPMRLTTGYAEDTRDSSLGELLKTGRVRILPDLEAYARARPESRSTERIVAEGARSSMTCALRVDDRIVGLLFRSSRRSNAYTAQHAHLHLRIAERLSQAVDTALQHDRLAEASRAASEMLQFISHEMATPLNLIRGYSDVLLREEPGPLNNAQRECVGRIRQGLDRTVTMIRSYLEFSQIQEEEFCIHAQPRIPFVESILDPALRDVQPQADARHMRIERDVPADLLVRCDPKALPLAVSNLLSNAVKYGRPESPLKVRARVYDGGWAFSVWNEGEGFQESQRAGLFRKFSRIRGRDQSDVQGSGLGLYIVWRIVERHGGRVFAESSPGEWAEFGFRLPS